MDFRRRTGFQDTARLVVIGCFGAPNPSATGDQIQDTRYRIQDTAYTIHIQAYRSRGIRRSKYARMQRTEATGYRNKADDSQPGGPRAERTC